MNLTRRALLVSVPVTAAAVSGASSASAASGVSAAFGPVAATAVRRQWISGVCDEKPVEFGTWRGSPVKIAGMFADISVEAQLEQFQFAHSTFTGDVDLAVGGPIDHTWAQVAAGSENARWKQMAAVLRANWHYRTVYLRFAHEFNGTWMPWSVTKAQIPAFKAAFRRFALLMRAELRGHRVKIVYAPNFGSWTYTQDSTWPGTDVVDVVGVSMYEWTIYNTKAKWNSFLNSSIGPNHWLAFAKRHGRPMAFSEWGGQSTPFLKWMNAWIAANAGTSAGKFLYDVYLNGNELLLTGAKATQYRALHWGY